MFVEALVVLYWSEFAVFLFNKEEGGGVGSLRGHYVSLSEVFFDEFLEGFPFFLGEGIDFSW
jgi:hypothetical protein